MKTSGRIFFSLCLVGVLILPATAQGGCWLDTYWPLNEGDFKTFSYGGKSLTISVSSDWSGGYQMYSSSTDGSAYEVYQIDQDQLVLTRASVNSGWIKLSFNPYVLLLDDAVLMRGGARTTHTTVKQTGGSYSATFTVRTEPAGTVTVPAGTFYNCRSLTVSETATVPGQGTVSAQFMTAILAPRVGLIKKLVSPGVWAQMTSGSVGGIDVGALSGPGIPVPPAISSQPKNATVTHGSVATLTVAASGGGALSYLWFKGNAPLEDDVRISGTHGATLKFNPALLADQGSYSVLVINAACLVSSTPAALTVVADLPTLAMSAPAANQRVSNAVFTVSGKASDRLGVSNVVLRVNGGAFIPTDTTNQWTNWSATVVVERPGTNTILAQAQDLEGVVTSLTTRIIYVLSDQLTLITNPPAGGAVVGVAGGQRLELGRSYRATAVPRTAAGFGFSGWEQSTNGLDWVTSTGSLLTFTMRSNLILRANFVDVKRPQLKITSPIGGQRVSNAVVLVKGIASDNLRVASVWCQLNTNAWQLASGTSNWSASVTLSPGLNTLRAFARDEAGIVSITNSLNVVYVLSAPVVVQVSGGGTVVPNYNGAMLELGKSYSMTATKRSGWLFAGWSGSTNTTSPAIRFTMASNLVFTATFVTNWFPVAKGDYQGLFYPTNADLTATNAGFLALTLFDSGAFSGRLQLQSGSWPFSGRFDPLVTAQTTVARSSLPSLTLALQLDPVRSRVIGQVVGLDWQAALAGLKVSVPMPHEYAGHFTARLEPDAAGSGVPGGVGVAAIVVSASGTMALNGSLPDGANWQAGARVCAGGATPIFSSLYSGGGLALGWLTFQTNHAGTLDDAELTWVKPPGVGDPLYPNGVVEVCALKLSRYQAPAVGANATGWSRGLLNFAPTDHSLTFTNYVVLSNNVARLLSGVVSNLNLSITPASGLFSGSGVDSATQTPWQFKGALVQPATAGEVTFGAGWFRGTGMDGSLRLEVTTNAPPGN